MTLRGARQRAIGLGGALLGDHSCQLATRLAAETFLDQPVAKLWAVNEDLCVE